MSTSLRDVVQATASGHAALVAEIAGYLVLLAADRASEQPTFADADSVLLDAEGTVHLVGRSVSAEESERSLRELLLGLTGLLRSPAPNLQRVAERREVRGISTLVVELEAALVPVNRRAAKRALARLFRETERAQPAMAQAALVRPVEPQVVASPARVAAPAAVRTPAPLPALVASPPPPRAASPLAPPVRASSVPPPLPERRHDAAPVPSPLPTPLHVAEVSRPARPPLTFTPPPPPEGFVLPASRPSAPPVSSAVAAAMLVASGVTRSPEPPPAESGEDGVWVEEEDVLTEFWVGTQLLGARDRTAIDAVAAESSSQADEREPTLAAAFAEELEPAPARFHSPLPSEAKTPIRISTFPLALTPEAASWSEDGPLLDTGESERRRPSDVSDLLSRMNVTPGSKGDLYRGLLGISGVELSPESPPVALAAGDD